MSATVRFTRNTQGELPFTLNLPDGPYPVVLEESPFPLLIRQGWLAVAVNSTSMIAGSESSLKSDLGDRWDTVYKHELRTVVQHKQVVDLPREELPTPNDEQLFVAMQQHLMRNSPGDVGGPEALQEAARQTIDKLTPEVRSQFIGDTSVRLAADKLFPARDVDRFCRAVNTLVRQYMVRFNDFFVQEVSESLFSNTAFRGILVATYFGNQELDHCRHVGGRVPFIIRRPWLEYPADEVERFRLSLTSNPEPDPVGLLSIRARSFLMRGGFRSALIEASAAFDLCLVRKIRDGYLAKGKTDAEIDAILNEMNNRRLDARAKKVLKDATGKSAAELDPPLWERFVNHRNRRGGVAHSSTEPTESDATNGVEDMLKLTQLISGIVVRKTGTA